MLSARERAPLQPLVRGAGSGGAARAAAPLLCSSPRSIHSPISDTMRAAQRAGGGGAAMGVESRRVTHGSGVPRPLLLRPNRRISLCFTARPHSSVHSHTHLPLFILARLLVLNAGGRTGDLREMGEDVYRRKRDVRGGGLTTSSASGSLASVPAWRYNMLQQATQWRLVSHPAPP